MARVASGETVTVRPGNNAFTVFAAAGFIVTLLGLMVLYMRAKELLGPGGLFGS